MTLYGAKIIGTGSYVPEKVLTNFDLEKMVETTDQWITERTGIKERHIAAENEPTSALAEKAARQAMEMANVTAEEIDLIIVATLTPDTHMPNCACQLQERLGAKNAAAFSIEVACSGFLYALKIAGDMIKCGSFKTVLITAAEELSKVTDWTDRNTCVLFGDGAGAVVLQRTTPDENTLLTATLRANGQYIDSLVIPAGGSNYPISKEALDLHDNCIKMSGKEVFKVAVESMVSSCQAVMEQEQIAIEDIRWLVPHQANLRIISAVGKRLNFPEERVFVNVHNYGNTSAASIPIALDNIARSNTVQRGDILLLTAFGGGFTWGAHLIRW